MTLRHGWILHSLTFAHVRIDSQDIIIAGKVPPFSCWDGKSTHHSFLPLNHWCLATHLAIMMYEILLGGDLPLPAPL